MKKLISALACTGLLASTMALVGCGDTSTVTEKKEVSTPSGTTKVEDKKTIKQTGDNPPPAEVKTPTPPAETPKH